MTRNIVSTNIAIVAVICGILLTPLQTSASDFGSFSASPIVELDPGGRKITLKESLEFVDDQRRTWVVPADYQVNGASVPRVLWSIAPPLVGKYRDATIIHDYFCDRRAHDWQEVHRLFYLGMRARGVGKARAWFMYKAVARFGPRWETVINIPENCSAGKNFDPEGCVLNSKPEIVDRTIPLNTETLAAFSEDMKGLGYESELATLRSELN